MATIKQPAADCLDRRDLVLCVFGPDDPRSECEGVPTVLWDPRTGPSYLRPLWDKHRATIEREAAAAGIDGEPWIERRLWFCALLDS